ncbi:MAG: hypothetical protein AAF787_10435 [Chloroflexota bacterium]
MPVPTDAVTKASDHTLTTTLHPTAHFNFTQSVEFIQNSGATNHLDIIADDHTTSERPIRLNDRIFWIKLEGSGDDVTVMLTSPDADPRPTDADMQAAVAWANRRFFMDVDMAQVKETLLADKYGEELVTRFFPARPANYPSAWEALIKSVIHAQIYPGLAQKLDDYLCRNYGTEVTFNGEKYYMVPTPEQLLNAVPDDLKAASFSRQKADYLTTIPQQILDDPEKYDFDAMRDLDGEDVVNRLKDLHGVGPWTAQNVAMRGLPHPDVFIDEKATRSTLTPYYGKEDKLTKGQAKKAVAQFAPYRTFACYYTYMKHFNME